MAVQEPNKIPRPFASQGSYETVPDSTTVYGHASWQKGFPSETALALSAGGVPPRWMDFQGIFHDITEHICYLQKGSHYKWDASVDYPVGAMVVGSDGKLYVSLRESGPTVSGSAINPVGDSSGYWQSFNVTDYLPLSGGTMTGSITLTSSTTFAKRSTDNSYMYIAGGSSTSTGSMLCLTGKDKGANYGLFFLRANNGEQSADLRGTPSGALTWNGKQIITEGTCIPLSVYNNSTYNIDGSNTYDSLFPYYASSVASSPFRYKYINLDGKDFDSLTVMGGYHVVWYTTFTDSDGNVHTKTLHAPITPTSNTMDGILIVEGLGGAAYISSYARIQQTLYYYTSVYATDSSHTRIFKRRGYLKDGSWSWSDWKEHSTPSMDIGTELLYPSESGSGWIRYSNGIQMCWGRSKGATESGGSTWTLPKAFKDTNFRVIGTACSSDNKNGVVFNIISTTTSTVVFKCIAIYDGNTSHVYSSVYAHYLAIGYWK